MTDWKKTLGELAPVIGSVFGPMGTAGGVLIKEVLGLSKDASDDDINLALLNPENQLKIKQMEYDYNSKVLESDTEIAVAQNKVNEVEASNVRLFISGWRPAAGWVCVFGLSYQIVFRPICGWIMENIFSWTLPPELDVSTLATLLSGMLGLGAYRMNEKIKGVSR